MLAGMDHDLVELASGSHGATDGGGLDELWARADDS
jgi:hypothetical protein